MELVRPTSRYKASYLSVVDEFRNNDAELFPYVLRTDTSDWNAFIQHMRDLEQGFNLRKGIVPSITFWMIDADDEVVGISSIRTRLNPTLVKGGGHIGYGVRPSRRRQGCATELLRLSLRECSQIGLKDILISCAPSNEGSRRTILANGGFYDSTVASEDHELERYWIFI